MGSNVWDLVLANDLSDDLGELEAGLLGVDSVWVESSLGVHKDSEVLVGLLDGENIHVSEWESWVSSDSSVNLDETFLVLNDLHALSSGKRVLKSVLEEHVKWDALSELVWTW